MGLLATELTLTDFRSAHERRVELAPATTVLVGPNASGKTNTVEALQMLTAGFSFRKPTPAQLVREGAPRGRAQQAPKDPSTMTFEDKLKAFMTDSESRQADVRHATDRKNGSRRRR